MSDNNQNWERNLLEKLATASLAEQRRARQWKIFFRLAWLVIAAAIVASIVKSSFIGKEETRIASSGGHTAELQLAGAITLDEGSANKLIEGLRDAIDDKNTRGILIRANSPGGSPVLSGMIYDEIRRQKRLHPKLPIVTVVEEVCASGCYYIASATDKIYVDKASVIGSIGVISEGFGVTGLMEKLGVENRVMTAGENKAMGDPFSPRNAKHDAIRQQLLNDIHQQFIKAVQDGRGARLKPTPDMFSGMVWLGEKSVPLGLADGYGTVDSVARDVIKADKLVDFTPQDDFGSRFARRLGVEFKGGVKSLMDTRFF